MKAIRTNNNLFYIETADTCYVFAIVNGFAEHLYYGAKIPFSDCGALIEKRGVLLVNTLYPIDDPTYGIDAKGFEFSLPLRGDGRSASICLNSDDSIFDFVYEGYDFTEPEHNSPMPLPRKYDAALTVRFRDNAHEGVCLNLIYLVNYRSNVISRFCELVNGSDKTIEILKFSSAQTDMSARGKKLVTFRGAWGREMSEISQEIKCGKYVHGSYSGMSSAECNPLFFVADLNASQDSGEVYGFNLMYSASHEFSAEVTPYGGLRILQGIQSENLKYALLPQKRFVSPCAITVFSSEGFNGASRSMHCFAREAVIAKRRIPVMLNTWEAKYFDIDESAAKRLADKAVECGFECLVIDDGWFGNRNDDTSSLGDWFENRKKFPGGLKKLSAYLKSKNLITGIWIEPEMVSEDSDLYRAHPDYVLKDDRLRQIVGRGQYILDLTDPRVKKYVYDSVARLKAEYGAGYVKWDFNRRFSEIKAAKGSGYFYDYVSALYSVLSELGDNFPDLLIENCASGGGRFDLGMARYTACGWASDNTEPTSRARIQQGVSYGYPPCFTLNHVAADVGHQTMRGSLLKDRINTAFLGVFGVQADITVMNDNELEELKEAVTRYKSVRDELYSSAYYRIATGVSGCRAAMTVAEDGGSGFVYFMNERFETVTDLPRLKLRGLDYEAIYRICGECVDISVSGETLCKSGLILPQNFQGAGTAESVLALKDGGTLLLQIIRKE